MKSKILDCWRWDFWQGRWPQTPSALRYFYAEVTQVIDDVLNLFPSAVSSRARSSREFRVRHDRNKRRQLGHRRLLPLQRSHVIRNSGNVHTTSIAAIAVLPDDRWELIARWDFPETATGGPRKAALRSSRLSGRYTEYRPDAPGFVGEGSGHPIFIPDPLSLVNVGSFGYIAWTPNFVLALAGFSVQLSLTHRQI